MNREQTQYLVSQYETSQPHTKVVFLGASNLSRAFPSVVETAMDVLDHPLEIYAALGHGRSFGAEAGIFFKIFSGISRCGLWSSIESQPRARILAFVTDIGNDLGYEAPVDRVVGWVRMCLDRLVSLDAQVLVCDLPMDTIRQVSPTRYRMFRTLLFPNCRLDLKEMLRRAEDLSEAIRTLAEERKMPVFVDQNAWYGLDPIHPQRKYHTTIWRDRFEVLLGKLPPSRSVARSLSRHWYLRCLRAQQWRSFGIQRSAPQPNGRLIDGTIISLY